VENTKNQKKYLKTGLIPPPLGRGYSQIDIIAIE